MSQKTIVWIIVVAIILLGGGALIAANRNNNKTNSTTTTNSSNNNSSTSSTENSSTSTQSNAVTIENMMFSPASITVKKGTAVTWTNKDAVTHTVTENDEQKGPDSGDLASGKTYSFTYDTVGTFKYHCAIHPNMTGTVTVTE